MACSELEITISASRQPALRALYLSILQIYSKDERQLTMTSFLRCRLHLGLLCCRTRLFFSQKQIIREQNIQISFCHRDLDLYPDPMTLICELNPDILKMHCVPKMKVLDKDFQVRAPTGQTDRQTRPDVLLRRICSKANSCTRLCQMGKPTTKCAFKHYENCLRHDC